MTATAVDGARVSPGSPARSGQPGLDAGSALADALGAPGAAVVLGQAPAGAETLATVRSAPIARLVEQALSMSDNMLAEALARHVAHRPRPPGQLRGRRRRRSPPRLPMPASTSPASRSPTAAGCPVTTGFRPALLAAVVRGAADGSLDGASALLSGLPVAGYDGTLSRPWGRRPATAPGTVRAKTGTLLGVHALAGTVVTVDGRLLAFAVLADGATGERAAAEAALDDFAAALAACGCR